MATNDSLQGNSDQTLLILGLASFILWPFTAVPGVLIGRRQRPVSQRGKFGYALCWICLVLFCLHLVLLGALILAGRLA